MTEASHLAKIRAMWPDHVPPDATIRATRGQFNDVLIVAESVVVRVPRTTDAARGLAIESRLLQVLQGRLPLPIPNPEPVQNVLDAADAAMGYRLIPGEALTWDVVTGLEEPAVASIACQLGEFLRHLHAIPLALLPPDLPVSDGHAAWSDLYAGFQRDLYGFMRPDARAAVTASFAAFLSTHVTATFTPVLRHGDLGGENIRYDPATTRITGVIDFGAAAYGDPAVDLATLSWYGEPFVTHLIARYPDLANPHLRARAAFYRSTHALQQALWAHRAGDPEEFAHGIAAYT